MTMRLLSRLFYGKQIFVKTNGTAVSLGQAASVYEFLQRQDLDRTCCRF
jgi:hypothetical protein